MQSKSFPVIDPIATGQNILRLRETRGLTVRDLQIYFGFEEPQAIYKWQCGKSLPSVDNLYALAALLEVPMDAILVPAAPQLNIIAIEQQDDSCCSIVLSGCPGGDRFWGRVSAILSCPVQRPSLPKEDRTLAGVDGSIFLRHHSQQTMRMETYG